MKNETIFVADVLIWTSAIVSSWITADHMSPSAVSTKGIVLTASLLLANLQLFSPIVT